MKNILDKFGIYDLVAVLLSGISILACSLLVLQFVYGFSFSIEFYVNETLSFLVISYFLGIVFQEIGSLIQRKVINKNDRLLDDAFKLDDNSHIAITEYERDGIYAYVNEILHTDQSSNNDVYNYCKFYVITNCDTTRVDKDQSLSAMSRSLSLYFCLLAIIVFITLFWKTNLLKIVIILISVIISILLYQRCVRFVKLRYVNIFRTFYYKELIKHNLK